MTKNWRDGLLTFEELLEEDLKDPEFRAEWERTALARTVAIEVLRYRIDHGLTQTELARILGMKQPAISRLEIGETNPSWDMLVRLADVLGMEFLVDIAPAGHRAKLVGPQLKGLKNVQRLESRGARITVAAI